ncbi:hypothetical protein [Clostridium formicaceticum]|uniref:Uncharacterized protein n=1 Tax=Clostridium formicaceticum TaxID=1497 RepID=A0AAC9RLS5_9CLOT|nr:hypothetical protein [Clostridium formicaceticum]AOY76888.1 hypothetical protein BJL90_14120 [Clostridium formicaceticum]ARE87368.1 hypothetical protein CLFO_17680 [Clostridium formicaceticum]
MHYEQALLKSLLNRGYIDRDWYMRAFEYIEKHYAKKERKKVRESKKDDSGRENIMKPIEGYMGENSNERK